MLFVSLLLFLFLREPFESIEDKKMFLFLEASLNVMSEMFYIPIEFEEYVR
jgi:hypothetical protein